MNLLCFMLHRYSIDQTNQGDAGFSIDAHSGVITTNHMLDREEAAWHNITVMASETGKTPSFIPLLFVAPLRLFYVFIYSFLALFPPVTFYSLQTLQMILPVT